MKKNTNFSERVKYVRGMLLITQTELANKLGISYCTINRLENAKTKPNYITIKKFEKFCKETNIDWEDLL